MLDGNRRWAREAGFVDVNDGHRVGAAKIADLLAWCEEEGVRGRHALPALHRQPEPARGRARPAAGDHRRRRRRAERARRRRGGCGSSGRWTCCRAGIAHRLAAAAASAPSGARGMRAQRRGRLRRPAGDRRRGAQAAAAATPRAGTSIEELAEVLDVDHIAAAPVHLRPARPRPRHPHLGGAAAVRLPAVAVGALGVLVLRGLLAGVPQGGLPARAARLRRPTPPLRVRDVRHSTKSPDRVARALSVRWCEELSCPG